VEQSYRTELRVRDRQSGQAGRYRVRTGKGKNQAEEEKKEAGKRQELTGQTLVSLTNKTNCTDRQKTQV
jgi:hypothetical protein